MTDPEDPNPLVSLFRQCVARISDGEGRFRGTGFFAAPGQLVTCAHVAHGAQELRVQWQDRNARAAGVVAVPPLDSVTNPAAYPLPDLAVMSVEDAQGWDHPCVGLAAGRPVLDGSPAGLYLAGYTVEHAKATALTGATAEFESLIREDGQEFLKLKRGRVLPGLSGSPLLDLRAGAVTGIVESSRGQQADLGGFAVPASTLAAVFPDLAAENRRFHDRDPRWAQAAEAERTRAADRDGQRARLPLRAPVIPLKPDAETSPATVLRPRHAFVGYVGRERLLADIAGWCEQGGETVGL
ncbi:MAG TPA: serine protease, partial [Streptosporangiaceae bacterium]